MNSKVKELVFTALFAAIMCVVSPFSVQIGPIPISLATLIVYISAAATNKKTATAAVSLYVLIGAVGLPVFSGGAGGIGKLIGPTGGYIIGYIACVFVTALIIDKFSSKIWVYPIAMVAGTVALYSFGTIWFMFLTKNSLWVSLMNCVFPFILGDSIKMIAAAFVGFSIRKVFYKYFALKRSKIK